MNRDKAFINTLQTVFPERPINDCLDATTAKEQLVIEDDTGCSQFVPLLGTWKIEKSQAIYVNGEQLNGFLCQNETGKTIYILSVDGCVFGSGEQSRCDCLIFDDACLCFVELKLDVTKARTRSKQIKKARAQLGATIQFFKHHIGQPLLGFELEAYIALQSHIYPSYNPKRQIHAIQFLEKHGVGLFETNFKQF